MLKNGHASGKGDYESRMVLSTSLNKGILKAGEGSLSLKLKEGFLLHSPLEFTTVVSREDSDLEHYTLNKRLQKKVINHFVLSLTQP